MPIKAENYNDAILKQYQALSTLSGNPAPEYLQKNEYPYRCTYVIGYGYKAFAVGKEVFIG